MTFYTEMRDDVAGPLIREFGRSATLFKQFRSYDATTGSVTLSPGQDTSTTIYLLQLPIERPKLRNIFRDETVQRASWQLVISGEELAAASVTPEVEDQITFDGRTYQITDILRVAPGGTDVIYKVLVEG